MPYHKLLRAFILLRAGFERSGHQAFEELVEAGGGIAGTSGVDVRGLDYRRARGSEPVESF